MAVESFRLFGCWIACLRHVAGYIGRCDPAMAAEAVAADLKRLYDEDVRDWVLRFNDMLSGYGGGCKYRPIDQMVECSRSIAFRRNHGAVSSLVIVVLVLHK